MKTHTKLALKIYWQHAKRYRLLLFIVFFSAVGAALTGVVIPLYLKKFVDILASPGADASSRITSILTLFAVWLVAQWALWRINTFSFAYWQTKIVSDLFNTCYQYLHRHSYSFFNNTFVGSLVKKVQWFSRGFENISATIVWNFLHMAVQLVFIVAVLFGVNTVLGLGMIVWLIVFLVVAWIFSLYKLKFDIKRSESQTAVSRHLADTITNHNTVRLFGGFGKEKRRFWQLTQEYSKRNIFSWNLNNYFEMAQGVLVVLLEFGSLFMAAYLWKRGQFTVGDFVLLQTFVWTIFDRTWEFGRNVRHFYQDLADAEEMSQIFDTPHDIQDKPGAKDLKAREGKIEFADVTFNYHETRKVLDKFNLVINSRERVGLVGQSGAGKTTIVGLLLRLFDVGSGKILIDGQNIADVTQESLRRATSMVPQDPILFHRTLMENIRYGRADASDAEVMKAAKLAHCHEFISDLPDKYDTYVGERGVKLSGGERQRVAIARAILRDAPILVLDEATSSLDSESEKLIQEAMLNLMKDKTVIIIAHRLSTLARLDRIVVIEEGGIIEEGSHESLLKNQQGIYNKLWNLQAGGFIV
ncbi:ABC transporter ATP-binding protein [Patescibacteria group bacterium]|nr:MAG: ABC transporter ATP-binding protein [Patescibacteria group bacterium]